MHGTSSFADRMQWFSVEPGFAMQWICNLANILAVWA